MRLLLTIGFLIALTTAFAQDSSEQTTEDSV
ncbi:MAG: hypothetical protein ACI9YU_002029, partial [Flavobacteriales bacterium]